MVRAALRKNSRITSKPAEPPKSPQKATKRKMGEEQTDAEAPLTLTGKRRKMAAPVSVAKPKPKPKAKPAKSSEQLNAPPTQRLDVWVCGSGEFGELGLGSKRALVKYPHMNDSLDAETVGVVQVAVGGRHCLALTHDQKILTWGANDTGALGRETSWDDAPMRDVDASESEDGEVLNPTESTPTAIPAESFGETVSGFAQLAATDNASFALTTDGFVYGWGTFYGASGKMGLTEACALKAKDARFESRPVLIQRLKNIKSLAAGGNHMLALDHSGNIFAWGCGQQRQLGRRLVARRESNGLTPCQINSPRKRFAKIWCGACHSFATDEQGRLFGWGLNTFGQTGIACDGEGESIVEQPTEITSLQGQDIRDMGCGTHHSLACTMDGELLVWGRCDNGQLGLKLNDLHPGYVKFDSRGKPRNLSVPILPGSIGKVRIPAVACGVDNSLAITRQDGEVYAWGSSANYYTGLRTEKTVKVATKIRRSELQELTFAGCGGKFFVLAGVPYSD
ncbi:MAG: hypothetical protein M1825_005281 [Sarcosagium campestre]|nr:MAG: hypothetical protein M1825_005281 [Sarcosagium campestre]